MQWGGQAHNHFMEIVIISLIFLIKCPNIHIKLRTATHQRDKKKKNIIKNYNNQLASTLVYESNVITHHKKIKIRRGRKVCTQTSAHTQRSR